MLDKNIQNNILDDVLFINETSNTTNEPKRVNQYNIAKDLHLDKTFDNINLKDKFIYQDKTIKSKKRYSSDFSKSKKCSNSANTKKDENVFDNSGLKYNRNVHNQRYNNFLEEITVKNKSNNTNRIQELSQKQSKNQINIPNKSQIEKTPEQKIENRIKKLKSDKMSIQDYPQVRNLLDRNKFKKITNFNDTMISFKKRNEKQDKVSDHVLKLTSLGYDFNNIITENFLTNQTPSNPIKVHQNQDLNDLKINYYKGDSVNFSRLEKKVEYYRKCLV